MAFPMILAVVAMVAVQIPAALSFSAGAPNVACVDMVPQHHVASQPLPSPYTVSASHTSVKSGDSVNVEIKGNTATDTIKGYMLQARIDGTPVGHFEVTSPNVQLIGCNSTLLVSNL